MSRFEQLALGRCDFLEVLEESVLMRAELEVELSDGAIFRDRLLDVRTESGLDVAVFETHPPAAVGDVIAVTRERIVHTYPS